MNKIFEHLKNNDGSSYLESIICLTLLLITTCIIFSVVTSMNQKLWIDEKLSDIAKLVDSSGTTKSTAITAIEDALVDRFGGEVTYEVVDGSYVGDPAKCQVQLNDVVIITFSSPAYTAINVGGFNITTPISVQKTAVSGVYYKTSNGLID